MLTEFSLSSLNLLINQFARTLTWFHKPLSSILLLNYLTSVLIQYLFCHRERLHASSTVRSQESGAVDKKKSSLKHHVSEGLLHIFAFPSLCLCFSWHALSLTDLLSSSSLQSRCTFGSTRCAEHLLSKSGRPGWRPLNLQPIQAVATQGAYQALLSSSMLAIALIEVLGSCLTGAASLWSGLRWQGCVVPVSQASPVTTSRMWQGLGSMHLLSSSPERLGVLGGNQS